MSRGSSSHNVATKEHVLRIIDDTLALVQCCLKHPSIPEGKHIPDFLGVKLVPEVSALYRDIFWLYDQVDESTDFREPINAIQLGIFDYLERISRPMALRNILDNIAAGLYSNGEQVLEDVELVWRNCERYNGAESPYAKLADTCRRKLHQRIQSAKDSMIASDAEQDSVSSLIEEVIEANDPIVESIYALLEEVAPAALKDGELECGLLTVRACRELRDLIAKQSRKRGRE